MRKNEENYKVIFDENETEIIDWLYNNIYDPWTDDTITAETIKKDIESHNIYDLLYTLIEHIKELEN